MEQKEDVSFKQKVFDPNALQFCLSVADFAEAFSEDSQFLRRALLDALSFCESLEQTAAYLNALRELLIQKQTLNTSRFLNSAHQVGQEAPQELTSFLLTVQKLAALKHFEDWEDFLTACQSIVSNPWVFSDFLATTRYPAESETFESWKEYFVAVKKLSVDAQDSLAEFFKATRHSLPYFQRPESFKGIFRALAEIPRHTEAFAYGQLDSKKWLIEEATRCWGKEWGTVFVLAGWIGVLPRFIFDKNIKTTKVRSFDTDPTANQTSEFLNQFEVQNDWHYKSSFQDVTKLSYPAIYNVKRKDGSACELTDAPDVVINTSCEHIADIAAWWEPIPKGTKVILQTNDGFHIPEHVACFKTLNDFEKAMNLSTVDYRGEKALPEFNRFMLIGVK